MRVLLDVNVLMDVFERRNDHYEASARVVSLGIDNQIEAWIPGHAPTTIHYLATRYLNRQRANDAIDWLLANFQIATVTRDLFLAARKLEFVDFEDAVVAAMAEREQCELVVTRSERDFAKSPVPPISPTKMLEGFFGER